MPTPSDKSNFVVTLRDQNNKLLTGKTVQIKESGSLIVTYTLVESAARPGTYYHTAVICGYEYDVLVDGDELPEWSHIPFGSGVGRDPLFLEEHTADGKHGEINVTKISFY